MVAVKEGTVSSAETRTDRQVREQRARRREGKAIRFFVRSNLLLGDRDVRTSAYVHDDGELTRSYFSVSTCSYSLLRETWRGTTRVVIV